MALDEQTNLACETAWYTADRLCCAVGRGIQPDRVLENGVKQEASRLLKLAESLVRRCLWIVARAMPELTLTPKAGRAVKNSRSACKTPKQSRPKPLRAPLFRLTEPLQKMPSLQAGQAETGGPRLRNLNDPALYSGAPKSAHPLHIGSEAGSASKLARRLQALQYVLKEPEKAAYRMQLWLARQSAARGAPSKTGSHKLSPLRPGYPPGYSKRRRQRDPDTLDALANVHALAIDPIDTS